MHPDQSPEIPTVKDIQYLIEGLDGVIERKPTHPNPLPILFLRNKPKETTAQRFVVGYRSRLRDTHKNWIIPHAFVSQKQLASFGKDDLKLIDHIADNLQDFMPRSMGKLGLPTYCALRAVLRMPFDENADYDEQTAAVRTTLYKKYLQKHRGLRWLQAGLNDISFETSARSWLSVGLTIALKCLATPILWLMYGRHLQFGRRYQWFTSQIAELGLGSHTFLRACVQLARIHGTPQSTAPVQRVLLSALLYDLQGSHKKSFWSLRRSRRTTPFVWLFENIRSGNCMERRFIETYAAVRNDFPESNVFLMAAASGNLPEIPNIEHFETLDGAVHDLAFSRPRIIPDGAQALSIQLPSAGDQQDSAAKWWLFSHRVVVRRQHISDILKPAASMLLLLVVLGAGGFLAWRAARPASQLATKQTCSYTEKTYTDPSGVTTSERIGILGDKPQLDCSFSSNLRETEQQILKQNDAVQGNGFVTIVYVAPLDVPRDSKGRPKDGRQNQSGLWHLQGVARAQQSINEEAASAEGEGKLRVKILLANTGDQIRHGQEVADRVGSFAAHPDNKNWHIIGVAGINQSRTEARSIIHTFNTAYNLPVIGSSPTGDSMKDAGSSSYMIAAPNDRQAHIAAAFAHTEPIVGNDNDLRRARNAAVIMDDDDEYSYNLADDFRKHFATAGHTVLAMYNLPADGHDDPKLPEPALYSQETYTLQKRAKAEEIAQQICRRGIGFDPDRDIIFYASRSQEFDDVLYALQHNGCTTRLTVIGGSDLGQFRDYKKYPIIQDHFYYMAFAAASNPDNNELTAGPILAAYTESAPTGHFLNESDFARAYDSIFAYGLVANALSADDNPVTNETVKTFLSGSTPIDFPGISGYIRLAGAEKFRVSPQKPVLVLKPNSLNASVKLSCGWFSTYNDQSYGAQYWGYEDGDQDEFACPKGS